MGVFSEDAGTASSLSPLKSDDTAIGQTWESEGILKWLTYLGRQTAAYQWETMTDETKREVDVETERLLMFFFFLFFIIKESYWCYFKK